jgi:hypothetical protein
VRTQGRPTGLAVDDDRVRRGRVGEPTQNARTDPSGIAPVSTHVDEPYLRGSRTELSAEESKPRLRDGNGHRFPGGEAVEDERHGGGHVLVGSPVEVRSMRERSGHGRRGTIGVRHLAGSIVITLSGQSASSRLGTRIALRFQPTTLENRGSRWRSIRGSSMISPSLHAGRRDAASPSTWSTASSTSPIPIRSRTGSSTDACGSPTDVADEPCHRTTC